MNQDYLKWHYWHETICKDYLIRAIDRRNFSALSEIIILRENGQCLFSKVLPLKHVTEEIGVTMLVFFMVTPVAYLMPLATIGFSLEISCLR